MAIKNANSHPFQVEIVDANDDTFYANSHPYKVAVVGGHIGIEARIVDELPETGETGYIYLVLKEETEGGDIYDEYMWVLQQDGTTYGWEHIGATNEVTIKLYDEIGLNTDGAMTQKATTEAIFEQRPDVISFTLPASGWANNTQTITVEGVTADNVLIVSPTVSSMVEYSECKVYASAQGADSLTFVCDTTPTNDLSGCVIIFNTTAPPEPAPDLSRYGRIFYKKVTEVELVDLMTYNCTFEVIDNDLWEAYLKTVEYGYLDLSYSGGSWRTGMMGEVFDPESNGVRLVATDSWAQFGGRVQTTYSEDIYSYDLPTAEDFEALYNPTDGSENNFLQFSDGMDEITTEGIKGFEFGKEDTRTSIGNYFFGYCRSLETVEGVPETVTTISDCFLLQVYNLSSAINLPNVTEVGKNFLGNCRHYNLPVNMPRLTTVGDGFMNTCEDFNSTITAPLLTNIGNGFLSSCRSFNQPLVFSPVRVGNYFLNGCSVFNQPLDLSNVVEIGEVFLYSAKAFSQHIVVPVSVASIGKGFLCDAKNAVSVEIQTSAVPGSDDYASISLGTWDSSAPMYVQGITLSGTGAQAWKNALPDSSTQNKYRKLILA